MAVFHRVFEALLTEETAPRFFTVAFDLAQYVCRRLEADQTEVVSWLSTLVSVCNKYTIELEKPETLAAAILLLHGGDLSNDSVRAARLQLLRMKFPIDGCCPDMTAMSRPMLN